MPIKMHGGKEYFTVVERMDMLLEEQGKENYSLETDVTYDSGVVIVKATLTLYSLKDIKDDVVPLTRKYCGHALGEVGKAKTLEATETHAIGRALSSAGWFGSEFASANEMESYQKKPEHKPVPENENPLTKKVMEVMNGAEIIDDSDDDVITFGKKYKGVKWADADKGYLEWVSKNLDKYKDKALAELERRTTKTNEEVVPF